VPHGSQPVRCHSHIDAAGPSALGGIFDLMTRRQFQRLELKTRHIAGQQLYSIADQLMMTSDFIPAHPIRCGAIRECRFMLTGDSPL
jgi:hypothetical protein